MTASQNQRLCDQAKFHPLCLRIASKHTAQTLAPTTAGIYVSSSNTNIQGSTSYCIRKSSERVSLN